jgi:YidC/Oxa1 family membrane protein insertase
MFAGCLPLLLQWPFLSVLYLLFRSARVGGARNALLGHDLFGATLGSHWLGGAGPLSAQGAVFAGLFLLLAGLAWLSVRMARRFTPADGSITAALPVPVRAARQPGQQAPARPEAPGAGQAAAAAGALARLAPYVTVVVAAFVPLAAGLYLVTTAAWTLAERMVLSRVGHHP